MAIEWLINEISIVAGLGVLTNSFRAAASLENSGEFTHNRINCYTTTHSFDLVVELRINTLFKGGIIREFASRRPTLVAWFGAKRVNQSEAIVSNTSIRAVKMVLERAMTLSAAHRDALDAISAPGRFYIFIIVTLRPYPLLTNRALWR